MSGVAAEAPAPVKKGRAAASYENVGRKGPSYGTEIARQTFLYGGEDGRPVLDAETLSRISGVTVTTIWRHMPAWIKEREGLLAAANNSSIGIRVSPESMAQFARQTEFLASQATDLEREVEAMPGILAELRGWLKDLKKGVQPDEYQALSMAFQVFLRLYGNRRETMKLFLQVQARWKTDAGIEGLADVGLTYQKALAAGKARLESAAEKAKRDLTDGAIPEAPRAGGAEFAMGGEPDMGDLMEDI